MSSSGLCTSAQVMGIAHIRACANTPQQSGIKFGRNTGGGDKGIGRKERFKDEEFKGGGREKRNCFYFLIQLQSMKSQQIRHCPP